MISFVLCRNYTTLRELNTFSQLGNLSKHNSNNPLLKRFSVLSYRSFCLFCTIDLLLCSPKCAEEAESCRVMCKIIGLLITSD